MDKILAGMRFLVTKLERNEPGVMYAFPAPQECRRGLHKDCDFTHVRVSLGTIGEGEVCLGFDTAKVVKLTGVQSLQPVEIPVPAVSTEEKKLIPGTADVSFTCQGGWVGDEPTAEGKDGASFVPAPPPGMKTCGPCSGIGEVYGTLCRDCGGAGVVDEKSCTPTPVTPDQQVRTKAELDEIVDPGWSRVACPACMGHGWNFEKAGKKRVCPKCSGEKVVDACRACRGKGQFVKMLPRAEPSAKKVEDCGDCSGSGYQREKGHTCKCSSCAFGYKTAPCSIGFERVKCDICSGSGLVFVKGVDRNECWKCGAGTLSLDRAAFLKP